MYHLFSGMGYYPQSGLDDYVDPFASLEEAEAKGRELCRPRASRPHAEHDWWVVVTEADGRLIEVARGITGG